MELPGFGGTSPRSSQAPSWSPRRGFINGGSLLVSQRFPVVSLREIAAESPKCGRNFRTRSRVFPRFRVVSLYLPCGSRFPRSETGCRETVSTATQSRVAETLPVCSQYSSAPSDALADAEKPCRSGGFAPTIAVVEAADTRYSDELGVLRRSWLHSPTDRCVGNRGVDTFRVVAVDVLAE